MNLKNLGWNKDYIKFISREDIETLIFGRVISQSGKHYKIITKDGEENAILSNSFLNSITNKSGIPAVGDWVGIKKNVDVNICLIQHLLPRRNKLSRKVAGKKSEEQIIASNIDIVFIVTSADQDFNIRRLERYLSMVFEINAKPMIIINKIDKTKNLDKYLIDSKNIFKNVPIVAISAKKGMGIDEVNKYIKIGKTIVLIGSSGVGKSTLINQLLGYDRQKVGDIRRSDGKGRHITSSRELIILPGGGMIIDNPGIREIQLWSSVDGVAKTFEDIEYFSKFCKFRDCKHELEPGCAVKKAVNEGLITLGRLNNYKKLLREFEYSNLKRNIYERRKKDKQLGKIYRTGDDIRRLKEKGDE